MVLEEILRISPRDALAHYRASRFSPKPRIEPWHAAVLGCAAAVFVVLFFLAFAGLRQEDFHYPTLAAGAVGGALPFVWFEMQRRDYRREFMRHLEQIRDLSDDEARQILEREFGHS